MSDIKNVIDSCYAFALHFNKSPGVNTFRIGTL